MLSADGSTLYDDRAGIAVTPASTQKLIVAATAMADLGASYQYQTTFSSTGTVGDDGVLHGDLIVTGADDPSLRSDDLRSGIAALAKAGLRSIDGAIVVDASAAIGPEINPLWNPGDLNEDFETPVSAISIDGDTVEFHVTGNAPGTPASVQIFPASSAIHYEGSVTSSGDGSDDVIVAAGAAPNHFALSGYVPSGNEETFYLPVHDIPHYVGAVLGRMLHEAKISFSQPMRVGTAPPNATVLWLHRSPQLHLLVRHMLYKSDNHFADELLRTIAKVQGVPPTDHDGIAAERTFLAAHGIAAPGLHVVDGSGLAHANRVPATTLAGILSAAQRGEIPELYYLLPQGGRQGTLSDYDFTTALGLVRAKSGHLSNVSALAGYVNSRRHGRVIFVFIFDGSSADPDSAIVRAVDRLSAL